MSYVLYYIADFDEWEEYIINIKIDNFKKKLNYTMNDIGLNNSGLLSDYLYTDIDNIWKNLTLKLLSTITNYK